MYDFLVFFALDAFTRTPRINGREAGTEKELRNTPTYERDDDDHC